MSRNKEKEYSAYEAEYGEDPKFDLKNLWVIMLRYKYWFIASVLCCMVVAVAYLWYATPKYSVSSKILIKDKENTYYSNQMNKSLSEMGMTNSSNGFENELEIIGTKTLNKKVVRDLKLYSMYYTKNGLKKVEIYGKYSPYLVDIQEDMLDSLPIPITMQMQQEDKNLVVALKAGDFETEQTLSSFPAHVSTPYGNVVIQKNPTGLMAYMENELKATIYPLESVALAYAAALSVEATSRTTTVAELTLTDNLPERCCDYLNKLVDAYNEDANIDNNIEATRSRDFIDERLADISKDLNMTEAELAQFKQNSGIVDYTADATVDVSQNILYEQKLVDVGTQIDLINYLIEYCDDKRNEYQVVPANIGLNDNALNATIQKYNEKILERNRLLRSTPESSPAVVSITQEADGYFSALRTSLQSAKRQAAMRRNDLQSQRSKYSSRISSAPLRERALVDINRQQDVKSGLYLMLLKKREENLIQLASAAYKAKLIEEPIVYGPVSPRRNLILLGALALGLILPYLYYFLRNFFRYRIENEEELASLCKAPLLGTIPFVKVLAKENRTIVLKENRNSVMMEVYRSLRSNLPFVLKPDQQVILFTSTQAGEGKTCVSSNLAASMAFAGKKVLIMGLDIRKPRLAGIFNLSETEKGLSDFLSRMPDDYKFLESVIQKTTVSDNLDIIPAGTIPPNPAELLERENLASAVNYLKKKYDYILMDTAPVGLVSDTLTIAKLADVVLYVVRANYTLKADMGFINTLYENDRLPNINIVFNAVKQNNSAHSYYNQGYYYGSGKNNNVYGYGYGYGDGAKLEEV